MKLKDDLEIHCNYIVIRLLLDGFFVHFLLTAELNLLVRVYARQQGPSCSNIVVILSEWIFKSFWVFHRFLSVWIYSKLVLKKLIQTS